MSKKYFILISIILITFISCVSDLPPCDDNKIITTSGLNEVFITNEGNYQFGNSGVSFYSDGQTDAIQDLFKTANNRPLGDICQSMCTYAGRTYLVVNNSGKIEVVNSETFISEAVINGLISPRYFLPVSKSKAYVSDLYSNTISIIDLNTNKLSGQINCNGWTEEMALAYGKVFATNRTSDQLYVINTLNDKVEDSIKIGYGSGWIVEDKFSKLWILCTGDLNKKFNATLHRIDPVTHIVEQSYSFTDKYDYPTRLEINRKGDTLYFISGGIFQMLISDNSLPAVPFIEKSGRNFYSLGVNPNNGNIYVGDAIDYVQRGKIYIFNPEGVTINTFLAGINPGDFYFK
jgi:YVTN family beta-propeller protein